MLERCLFSETMIVDRIVELLNAPDEADHDEIKVCSLLFLSNHRCISLIRAVYIFYLATIPSSCLQKIHGHCLKNSGHQSHERCMAPKSAHKI